MNKINLPVRINRKLAARSTNVNGAGHFIPAEPALDGVVRPLALPSNSVSVSQEELVIPTYLPAAPDKNPMFLEKRVYQGSSGKVYPLYFADLLEPKIRKVLV